LLISEVQLQQPAILALEDGSIFKGVSIGVDGETMGEVVFNTAMTGYQEILTDPSYAKQIITLTYPHIGNVGTNPEDRESARVWAAGLVIRDLPLLYSNWRAMQSLEEYLVENNLVAIGEIDTRRLTRILREKGVLKGCIVTDSEVDTREIVAKAAACPGLQNMDLAKEVSTQHIYTWLEGSWSWPRGYKHYTEEQLPWHVVVYDFGVKWSILRSLVDHGCRLTVVPAQTPIEQALALEPDGIFLSNGPGDPAACRYAIDAIQKLSKYETPLFGICLGHQLLALGCGAKTTKMKFGHHGANHPVYDERSGQVAITSQNHGFTVDETTLPASLVAINHSLFDGTLQGIKHVEQPWFGFQGHPEASPGPHDVNNLFNHFIELIQKHSRATYAETK
jgi:carbamoyl-phosphate synthase small subunit